MILEKNNVDPESLSPLVLAYIGDAVFEVYIRLYLAPRFAKVNQLHEHAVQYVTASRQSEFLAIWEPDLTEAEKQIVRRGRNAKGNVPRHSKPIDYRRSTGFEALVGYLYLAGNLNRLEELLGLIGSVE